MLPTAGDAMNAVASYKINSMCAGIIREEKNDAVNFKIVVDGKARYSDRIMEMRSTGRIMKIGRVRPWTCYHAQLVRVSPYKAIELILEVEDANIRFVNSTGCRRKKGHALRILR